MNPSKIHQTHTNWVSLRWSCSSKVSDHKGKWSTTFPMLLDLLKAVHQWSLTVFGWNIHLSPSLDSATKLGTSCPKHLWTPHHLALQLIWSFWRQWTHSHCPELPWLWWNPWFCCFPWNLALPREHQFSPQMCKKSYVSGIQEQYNVTMMWIRTQLL